MQVIQKWLKLKLEVFNLSFKPLESFKISKTLFQLRFDTENYILKVLD